MARIKGPKKTNRYPDEYKIKAVQLADHPDILAKDVAEDLGIHPILLYHWDGKKHPRLKSGRSFCCYSKEWHIFVFYGIITNNILKI